MANWNFEDFLRRLEAIKGIGSLDELVDHVPGLGQILRDVDFKLEELDPIERILRAMTLEERLRPELLDGDNGDERRDRIANQSDSTRESVDSLISQFQRLRTMLRNQTPEDVLRDTIQEQTGESGREAWQSSPDAWRGVEPGFTPIVDENDDPTEEETVTEHVLTNSERVDDLLRKISATGMVSLSDEERDFLNQASQTYRNRRERP